MKSISLIFLISLFCFSCIDITQDVSEPDCSFSEDLFPPIGYDLIEIGEIDLDVRIVDFQYVNDSVGYVLVSPKTVTSMFNYNHVYKTIDGGHNWINLNAGFDHFTTDLHFVNENIGIVSIQEGVEDCSYYFTDDGGLTWTQEFVENISGGFQKVRSSKEGAIFSLLRDFNDNYKLKILKSEDYGNTWGTIYIDDQDDAQFGSNFLELKDDLLLLETLEKELVEMNFQGEIITKIVTPENFIQDVRFLSEDKIIVAYVNKISKSDNGGASWYTLLNRTNAIIGFESENEGVLLSTSDQCGPGTFGFPGLLISTSSGGSQWDEHTNLTRNVFDFYKGSHKTETNSYFFFLDKKQYEIKRN